MEPQTEDGREVTLEEAMAMGLFFQKNGQLSEAEEVYRRILAVAPEHPDALHRAGILAHQQGKGDEAVSLIERSLALEPDRADCYSNLGIIFKAQGRLDDAVAAYRRAIKLDPNHALAHCNLGVLLKVQGKPVEAEEAYRAAIRLNPDHVEAYHNLGLLLQSQKRLKEAVVCWCKVGTLSPRHPAKRGPLAWAYCTLGQPEKAIEIYERWLEEEPGNPLAEHMLAACSGQAVPARASDAYIETCYDNFASSFEAKLLTLSYRAPEIIGEMLADAGLPAAKTLDVLDAGCGTGLCGSYLALYARRLTGVDLSGGMLERAREKQLYDELIKAEMTAYLRDHPGCFDLIVSADTLCYFGMLEDVGTAASGALRPGGLLVFTVEELVDAAPGVAFFLQNHGRYCHAREYVERLLTQAGLEPAIASAELRMEAGAPVAGLAVRASKPARRAPGEPHA